MLSPTSLTTSKPATNNTPSDSQMTDASTIDSKQPPETQSSGATDITGNFISLSPVDERELFDDTSQPASATLGASQLTTASTTSAISSTPKESQETASSTQTSDATNITAPTPPELKQPISPSSPAPANQLNETLSPMRSKSRSGYWPDDPLFAANVDNRGRSDIRPPTDAKRREPSSPSRSRSSRGGRREDDHRPDRRGDSTTRRARSTHVSPTVSTATSPHRGKETDRRHHLPSPASTSGAIASTEGNNAPSSSAARGQQYLRSEPSPTAAPTLLAMDQGLWVVTNHPDSRPTAVTPIVPLTASQQSGYSVVNIIHYYFQWYRYYDHDIIREDLNPRRLASDLDEEFWSNPRTFFQNERLDAQYMVPETATATDNRVRRALQDLVTLDRTTQEFTVRLPFQLVGEGRRTVCRELRLRAMDMWLTVFRRPTEYIEENPMMAVHQTVLELRIWLETQVQQGHTITFITFANEVSRREFHLRTQFLQCHAGIGVMRVTLDNVYEVLIKFFVRQIHETLSKFMRRLTQGFERIDPMIRLPLNEHPCNDREAPSGSRSERRKQGPPATLTESRHTSLVAGPIARGIRHLISAGDEWTRNHLQWAIHLQIAFAAQTIQVAHWVDQMLSAYAQTPAYRVAIDAMANIDWAADNVNCAIAQYDQQTAVHRQQNLAQQQATSKFFMDSFHESQRQAQPNPNRPPGARKKGASTAKSPKAPHYQQAANYGRGSGPSTSGQRAGYHTPTTGFHPGGQGDTPRPDRSASSSSVTITSVFPTSQANRPPSATSGPFPVQGSRTATHNQGDTRHGTTHRQPSATAEVAALSRDDHRQLRSTVVVVDSGSGEDPTSSRRVTSTQHLPPPPNTGAPNRGSEVSSSSGTRPTYVRHHDSTAPDYVPSMLYYSRNMEYQPMTGGQWGPQNPTASGDRTDNSARRFDTSRLSNRPDSTSQQGRYYAPTGSHGGSAYGAGAFQLPSAHQGANLPGSGGFFPPASSTRNNSRAGSSSSGSNRPYAGHEYSSRDHAGRDYSSREYDRRDQTDRGRDDRDPGNRGTSSSSRRDDRDRRSGDQPDSSTRTPDRREGRK